MKFAEKFKEVEGKLWINNQLVSSKGQNYFQVINPATEELIGKAVAATAQDVDFAVKSAKHAFEQGEWSKMDALTRSNLLFKLGDIVDQNLEHLSYFESINTGKPITQCNEEQIPFISYFFRYFGGQADKINGKVLQMTNGYMGMTLKEPVGVCAQIIPWNYPLMMMLWKVAPAIAAGCTVVLKPAEQTPFTAIMLATLFKQAGFPPGVLNIVTGLGETGANLSQHKFVNKVSFTGSTEVGYKIMRNSHKENLKPVTLQLGGKSANIIFPDIPIEKAVEHAVTLFGNMGQSCVAGSRTFVHEDIYDKVVEGCAEYANKLVVGDPLDQATEQGAIVCKEQFQKILYYIEEGKKGGAKLVAGGHRVGEKGFFIRPTVFSNVEDHMKIATEEIFGPVMSILKWKDEQDVIKRANQLPYGLGAGVMTNDINKAMHFMKKLKAGTVYINCYDYAEAPTPFGGFKDSGMGKDLGDEGVEGYLLTKTVIIKSQL